MAPPRSRPEAAPAADAGGGRRIRDWLTPALLVLVAALALAVGASLRVRADLEREADLEFRLATERIRIALADRLEGHILTLQGAAGLFDASNGGVDRAEWRAYAKRLQAHAGMAGVQGLGFAQWIPAEMLPAHVRSVRAEGFPDYAVRPPGPREAYTAIVYLEPFTGRNLRAFGFDMFAEPVRRAAMEQARDTGRASLSGRVQLVQETDQDVQAGVLMYVPVYRAGRPLDTVAQRREALFGWTYSPFRMKDFVEGTLVGREPRLDFGIEIFDGPAGTGGSLLFRSGPAPAAGEPTTTRETALDQVNLQGRPWTLRFTQPAGIGYRRAWLVLGFGVLGSLALAALTAAFLESRATARALATSQSLLARTEGLALLGSWSWRTGDASMVWSEQLFALFGRNPAAGAPGYVEHIELYHPEDQPRVRQANARILTDGLPFEIEVRIPRPDGTDRLCMKRCFAEPGEYGHPVRLFGFLQDVTGRREAELGREMALEEAARFRAALDQVPALVYMKDQEGRYRYASRATLDLFGREPDTLQGATDAEFFPPEAVRRIREIDRRVLAGAHTAEEVVVPDGNGGERTYWEVKAPLAAGGLLGVSTDITARKRAESDLLEANAYLGNLIDHANAPIIVWDPSFRITRFNRAFEALTGRTGAEVLGVSLEILFPPGAAEASMAQIRRTLAGERWETVEIPILHRDGGVHTVLWNSATLFDAQGEAPVATIAQGQDITARKRIEAELQQSERKFRTLFEHLAEGVALHELVRDGEGRVVDYRMLDVNPAYGVHTGIPPGEAVGRTGRELYGTATPPYLEDFARVALGGEALTFETYFPPLDKHFRISAVSPREGVFATVFEDITERRRRQEELERKNAEMERFTYMVSHDLKSPLVTVRTFLGYLEQDLAQGRADRIAKDMGFIRDAAGRMGNLLEDLLEVSRVGRVVNPPVTVAYDDLVRAALAAVAGPIAARGVEVRVAGGPLTLFGDRARLEEVWQNLVENAVKYMGDQAEPRIEVDIQDGGPEPVFRVRDNGMGIDPRFQDRVFGLFEKLDPGSEGTGLGLALVKRIVELHGGTITLESEGAGRGTCFKFTLPLALRGPMEGAST